MRGEAEIVARCFSKTQLMNDRQQVLIVAAYNNACLKFPKSFSFNLK